MAAFKDGVEWAVTITLVPASAVSELRDLDLVRRLLALEAELEVELIESVLLERSLLQDVLGRST